MPCGSTTIKMIIIIISRTPYGSTIIIVIIMIISSIMPFGSTKMIIIIPRMPCGST